jgi:hypothetical protein
MGCSQITVCLFPKSRWVSDEENLLGKAVCGPKEHIPEASPEKRGAHTRNSSNAWKKEIAKERA